MDEHKQRAFFWHGLWRENGSPRHGPLAEVRKLTRAKFHYAVSMIKKSRDSVVWSLVILKFFGTMLRK